MTINEFRAWAFGYLEGALAKDSNSRFAKADIEAVLGAVDGRPLREGDALRPYFDAVPADAEIEDYLRGEASRKRANTFVVFPLPETHAA